MKALLLIVVSLGLVACGPEQEAAGGDVARPPISDGPTRPAATYTEPSQTALIAAERYMSELDKSLLDGARILHAGDASDLGMHIRDLDRLVDSGEMHFGITIFEPLGRCGVAASAAREWWHAQLDAARSGGIEQAPGRIKVAIDQFNQNRAECLRAADPVYAEKESAELKARFGGGKECLAALSIDPKTNEIVRLPRPAHCKN